jgi:glycosyltransferase involved in cell wall biosynthesis
MYKPSYVWPNPAFPFRLYFESNQLRIFIIENIQHNWEWLSQYHSQFRDTDYFFVYCGWYHSEYFAKEAEAIFCELGLNKNNFYFMYNQSSEEDNFSAKGFKGELLNQNCWLDENLVMKPLKIDKQYDAIYVGRFSAFKRHYLAEKVPNLALVAGNNHGNMVAEGIPDHIYLNENPLKPDEVCEKINQAKCGLILSEQEGACFASSEYLLCGIPVVSTPELGGRSVWYDDYNSIVCDPDPDAIADAVQFFIDSPRDPQVIRARHIAKANYYRAKFVLKFAELLDKHNVVGVNPFRYFEDNYIHKLRKSQKPDFEKLFSEK